MLVVIDMQPRFTAWEYALEGVLRAIREERERGDVIVLVEYKTWYGEDYDEDHPRHQQSVPEVRAMLKGYEDRVIRVLKDEDGGGDEIIDALHENAIPIPERLRICGVNTCACVYATSMELVTGHGIEVDPVLDACACDGERSYNGDKPEKCRARLLGRCLTNGRGHW